MLDLNATRQGVPTRDAATLVIVRDSADGLEVFCVERQRVGFLGGAVVFPGGKLDASDLDAAWAERATPMPAPRTPLADDAPTTRGLAIAACREAFEEAALLPVEGPALTHAELLAWRARVAGGEASLRALLAERGSRLDLAALHPLARWVTPEAESRRFDARFFLFVADAAATGAHDDHETTASFWASPADVLARFATGELQLAPPTHRTLEVLTSARDAREAVALAGTACLEPIRPRLVPQPASSPGGDDATVALVLPGDPEHDVAEARCPGTTRFVLRGERFVPEDAPAPPTARGPTAG